MEYIKIKRYAKFDILIKSSGGETDIELGKPVGKCII
jgi:hypothetical protein